MLQSSVFNDALEFSLLKVTNFDPTEVLMAIKGYMTHFFGCKACGQNFIKEVANMSFEVRQPYDEVKYLWQSNLKKKQSIKN